MKLTKTAPDCGAARPLRLSAETRALMSTALARHYVGEVERRLSDTHALTLRAIGRAHDFLRLSLTLGTAVVAWVSAGGGLPAVVAAVVVGVVLGLLLWRGGGVHRRFGAGSSLRELRVGALLSYYREDLGLCEEDTEKELLCDKLEILQEDIEGEEAVLRGLHAVHRWVVRVYAGGLGLVLFLVLCRGSLLW